MMANWYDYPAYWEMAFAEDTKPEADFIEACCRKYVSGETRRLLEPACGSGRLVVEMAKRGYQLAGFDLNQPSLDYLQQRLTKLQLPAYVFAADMADFSLKQTFDAAFNTFSTFRLLLTEEQAENHLRCVAAALRPGGIYLLGLHLLPPDASEESTERWRASRGQTTVNYTLRVTSCDRRARRENMRAMITVKNATGKRRLATEFSFRLYTAAQLRSLIAKVTDFELCDVYDYCYEIDNPLKLNNELADVILILRKKQRTRTRT
ncbi:MAG: class I SAM-dependent methyltransferase [Planctomycetota bacterium]